MDHVGFVDLLSLPPVAILLLAVSVWLDGKMVYEHGVAVTPGHN